MGLGPERSRVTANSGFSCEPANWQWYCRALKTLANVAPNKGEPDFRGPAGGGFMARCSRPRNYRLTLESYDRFRMVGKTKTLYD
jgi:hypothetical protein